MKDCNVNSKFNCSPYIKFVFFAFVLALAMMSCKQDVRIENDGLFSDAILLVENQFDSKILDRNSGKIISNDLFSGIDNKVQSEIDNVYSYQQELYFLLNNENKIKVFNQNNYNFITEYDFNEIGKVGDITFPNVSNFYVSLPSKNEILVVDRINQKLSQFYISVDANPTKLLSIGNLVFVACENSINVIRTGTKEVISKINLSGKPLLLSRDLKSENLLIITNENNSYFLQYYDVSNFNQVIKSELKSDLLDESVEMNINQIAIVNNELEYSWLGTSIGLFRIDLRNKGVYTFMSQRRENIKNIYFEPISNRILIMTDRNGLKDYIIANSRTGEYQNNYALPDNSKLIFPL